jgi:hypothetical protein
MQRRTARSGRWAAGVAVTSALLTGCFTLEATFTISEDATADVDYVVLIDTEQLQEFASLLGQDVGDLDELSGDALLDEFTGGDDPCGDLTDELADYEVSVREIDENGEVGVGCTVSGVPIAELNSLGDDASSFTIEQDDTGTRFSAVLEGVDELTGDASDTEMMTEMLGISLDDLFTIRFIVTAPGSLGANNATSTDGSTAIWDVKPDADFVADGDATMRAEWTPGGGDGGSSIWIIVAIIAGVAAVAALAVVLAKRSKTPARNDGRLRHRSVSAERSAAATRDDTTAATSHDTTATRDGTTAARDAAAATAAQRCTAATTTAVVTSGWPHLARRQFSSGTMAPRRSPTTCWRSTR